MTAPAMTKSEREDLQRLNASVSQVGNTSTHATCTICGKHDYVAPLHGERGGPLCCLLCVGQWNAEHGRRRRAERVVIKALKAYEAAGGRTPGPDFARLQLAASGILHEADGFVDFNDLTSELLDATIALTHPDKHPPERKAEANRVAQELVALKPFVFPAVVPEPEPPPSTEPRDESAPTDLSTELSRYPCPDCRDLRPRQIPHYYCAACKAEWEKRYQEKQKQVAAKHRAWHARRREQRLRTTPPTTCAICGTQFKGRRKDARFCSDRCRQRAHRQPVTDKNKSTAEHFFNRDSRGKQVRP